MKWVAAPGQARQLTCPGTISFLSGPANTIYSCGNMAEATALAGNTFTTFNKIKVATNEYICLQNKAEIYECVGNGTTEYEENLFKIEGEWVTDDNNKIQFCAPIGNEWTTDLDKNNGACLAASKRMPKTWPDIEWTGTKCCGDPEGGTSGKTYEDPWTKGKEGKAGGCYNNTFIASGKFADDEKTIINYLGSFYTCNPQLGEGETGTTIMPGTALTIKSKGACGNPLLNATFSGDERNILCKPDGQWMPTSSTARTKAKKTAWSQSQGCCEQNQCWDGSECRKEGGYTTVDEQGYRCEKEEWKQVEMKYSWDRRSTDFCKEANQCLIQKRFNETLDNKPDKYWSGRLDSERPKCIQSGQYISDNYCESGEWSSRTKLIAEQLTAIAGNNDYSLYCDRYENALNNYAYKTDYGLASGFLGRLCTQSTATQRTENCVNSICVMKYGNNIAFGTAINTDISGEKSPLQALNMARDECDQAKKAGGYNACGKNSIWYNHDTQSIIYAPGITRMPAPASNAIIEPYNKLKTYVADYVYNPEMWERNYTFFNITPQFKFLYMAKNKDKTAYSFKQENISDKTYPTDYAGWIYENMQLPNDACDRYIKKYDGKASCEEQPTETEFYVAAYRKHDSDTRASIIDAWPDTTGKLRINPG